MTDFFDNRSGCAGCVDLHTHSTASDGSDSPRELMRKAASLGLSVIALTDHDTLAGIPDAIDETKRIYMEGGKLKLVAGCEFSVSFAGKDVHLLGLFVNPDYEPLIALTHEAARSRDGRNNEMLSRFQKDGFLITEEELTGGVRTEITRAHFAKALVKKGYAKDYPDAFARFLADDCYYYVKREYLDPAKVIRILHEAGGIAVLAHPLQYRFAPEKLRSMIEQFRSFGLDAMETKYSAYSPSEEDLLRSLAFRYGLARSGGSDYHGTAKPGLQLGTGYGNGWCIRPEDVTVL
ncbi:MAG: PHP domain-containing protein [Lachnospiraceae bacterium]|nr:PHP domain-containing protein [Lachnospiraceae bacterium]